MNAIVNVLVLIAVRNYRCLADPATSLDPADPGPHCSGTDMTPFNRRDFLDRHNFKRTSLALGTFRKSFPKAKNMNYLTYDCDLESAAYDTAKLCDQEEHYDFTNTDSNNAAIPGDFFDVNFIFDVVDKWWRTAEKYDALVNLTPSVNDTPIMPFLKMANARTNKLGCAYYKCDSADSSSFYSFVCKYGEPHVKVGRPIYRRGRPCAACQNGCLWSSLCYNSGV